MMQIYSSVDDAVANGEQNFIVCDVFRASSSIVAGCQKGVRIRPFATTSAALEASKNRPGTVLAGEENGQLPSGFKLPNSPVEWLRLLSAKDEVYFVSSSGTVAIHRAIAVGGKVLVASFLNLGSVVQYVCLTKCKWSIIACGSSKRQGRFEDSLCAELIYACCIRGISVGEAADAVQANRSLLELTSGGMFLKDRGAGADVEYILNNVNLFDVVPKISNGWINGF